MFHIQNIWKDPFFWERGGGIPQLPKFRGIGIYLKIPQFEPESWG